MSGPQRPGHTHPKDSICLVISCPRGAWDAAVAAFLASPEAAEGHRQAYHREHCVPEECDAAEGNGFGFHITRRWR